METKMKEKMLKWSRKVGTLTKVTRGLAVVVLILIALYILSIFGIQLVPRMIWKIISLVVVIPLILLICMKDLLAVVAKHGKSIWSQKKRIYVFLSDKAVVKDILIVIWAITLLLPFRILSTVSFIVMLVFPKKIAKHFEAKWKK